jgi:hypothetical protein
VIDEEEPSLRPFLLDSNSGDRFSGFVSCDSSEMVRVLTVHAVDVSGCLSPAGSFTGVVVEGSGLSEAVFLNDRDSAFTARTGVWIG